MRRGRLAAVVGCGIVLSASGAIAASPTGALSISELMQAAAVAKSGDPDAVQRQYEVGRATEETLSALAPKPACVPLYDAVVRVAHGNVLAAEGFDRLNARIRARGERDIVVGKRQHDRARASCAGGFGKKQAVASRPLTAPLEGEAFFGSVRVSIPKGLGSVELRWRGRVVAQRTDPDPGFWSVVLPSGTATGRGTLEARFQTGAGEVTTASAPHVWLLPVNAASATTGERKDNALAARLATTAAGFPGFAGIYIHDMSSGRTGAWNDEARFPAASTVKLGVLAAALDRYGPRPERNPKFYDMRTLAAWSSNVAANRLLRTLGAGDTAAGRSVVENRLRSMGATRSAYPGEYRVGTAHGAAPTQPPLVSQRTTSARDLGRVLTTLHAAAAGNAAAQRAAGLTEHEARVGLALLLDSEPVADNVGLFRPWVGPSVPMAQKHGWISSARHTAAIVYGPKGPIVVVLTTYREGLTLAEAQRLGQKVIIAALT
jgi:beta-lactamase class A